MSIIRNQEDLIKLRYSSKILASCLEMIKKEAKPGVSTGRLDKLAETFIRDYKAIPSFKNLYGFPNTLISEINEEVVHGLSLNNKFLPETGVVSFDCGVNYQGLYSDMAIITTFGNLDNKAKLLVEKTEEALFAGIKEVKAGKRIGDIGYAVNKVLSEANLGNVIALGGHGLGYKPHDEPHIVHKAKKGSGSKMFVNQVIAIEPMVTLGSGKVIFENIPNCQVQIVKSKEKVLSAHIEHTVLVTKEGYEILTLFSKEELLN